MSARKQRFVAIRAVQQVRVAVNLAVSMRHPVLVVGDAGLGKTTALKQIAEERDAAYWEVAQFTKTILPMFRSILHAYDIGPYGSTSYRLGQQILLDLELLIGVE